MLRFVAVDHDHEVAVESSQGDEVVDVLGVFCLGKGVDVRVFGAQVSEQAAAAKHDRVVDAFDKLVGGDEVDPRRR